MKGSGVRGESVWDHTSGEGPEEGQPATVVTGRGGAYLFLPCAGFLVQGALGLWPPWPADPEAATF